MLKLRAVVSRLEKQRNDFPGKAGMLPYPSRAGFRASRVEVVIPDILNDNNARP